MNITVCHPFIQSLGGGDRLILEIAKRFNPTIYSVVYEPDSSFPELKEFDIRILPKSKLEIPFGIISSDKRRFNAVSAGFRYYFTRFKHNYDAICAVGSPSEWIRNYNERVSWFCLSPNREKYDLHDFRMKELPFHRKLLNHALLTPFDLVEQSVVPNIEQVLTTSEIVKARISKYLNRPDASVIAPGVDCKEFTNSGYNKYFLYPSRIVPEKRFEMAIESFRIFSKTHKGWKLTICGFLSNLPRDQAYHLKLRELSKGLDVEFRLNVTEAELKKLYANCYAVLFTAINEDFALIPLEAGASEKPCISVNEGGPTYTIVNNTTGYLTNSVIEMASKMTYLAEHPDQNELLGHNGRNRMLQHYTWKRFLDELEKSLKQVTYE